MKAGVFRPVEERNGKSVRIRYFDLSGRPVQHRASIMRHSLASWLVSNGVDGKTVSMMLRHANSPTTLGIYSHAVDANKLAAPGQYMDTLLAGHLFNSGTKSRMGNWPAEGKG